MVLAKILPMILLFFAGYILKRLGILEKKDAKVLTNLLIYLIVPIVIINAVSKANITKDLLLLPVSAVIIVICLILSGFLIARFLNLRTKTKGVFIISFATFEGGTIGYSFMLAAFGEAGLSRIVIFDFGQIIIAFTLVYFIACRFGNSNAKVSESIKKTIRSPLIWSIVIGLILNMIGFDNAFVNNFFDVTSGALLFAVMVMLGLEFQPVLSHFKLPAITILLKTVVGLSLGYIVSIIFGFTGVERAAVLVMSSLAPSILVIAFSEQNGLDTEYAANLLSIAIPFSIILVAALIGFL